MGFEMKHKKLLWKRFAIIALVIHIPVIAVFLDTSIAMIPALFWVNIPVLWTGVASAMGETHFLIEEFGAVPQSYLAYGVITSIWLVFSFITAFISVRLSKTH